MPALPVCSRAAVGLFVVAASFIPLRVRAQDDYREPRNADVSAAGARLVRIEAGAGLLRVEGHQGTTQVRVRGTARTSRRGYLANIKLIAERRGDEVFIKADIDHERREGWRVFDNGHFLGLDLVIEVPTTLPLEVDDGSGEARFLNTGALTLEDGSGEIEIRGARGDVRVVDGSGEISIDGVEGSVTISDGSGEIRGRNVTGNFVVREDGSGDIDVSGVGGSLRVEDDGSGNIDVERVAGDFVVESDGGGRITYDTVKGSVRIPERKRRS